MNQDGVMRQNYLFLTIYLYMLRSFIRKLIYTPLGTLFNSENVLLCGPVNSDLYVPYSLLFLRDGACFYTTSNLFMFTVFIFSFLVCHWLWACYWNKLNWIEYIDLSRVPSACHVVYV